jgi:hypothetical protein
MTKMGKLPELRIRKGGNPPDAGSLYLDKRRVAFLPVWLVDQLTDEQAHRLVAEWRTRGRTLGRNQVLALLDPAF